MKQTFTFLFLLFSSMAFAVGPDPSQDWRSFDTTHFVVHYPAQQRVQAEQLAAIAEGVYPRITTAFDWQPKDKTEIVLLDVYDVANGFATPLPFNHTAIFLTPPDEGELLEVSDWFELVFTHEFTHIVHLDKARGAPNVFRHIFGRQWFTFPNFLQPTWAIEGLATFIESDEAQHQGRLANSYYNALMQLEVANGLKSLREINANGRAWPLSKAYLYGAYFYQFLTERYGQQAVFKYVNGYSDNIIPFRVHSNPVSVTGKTMDVLWQEYLDWLSEAFSPLNEKRQQARLDGDALNSGEWFTSAPAQAADGAIFYIENDGLHRAQLHRRILNDDQIIDSIHNGARLYARSAHELLVAQPEICDNYNYYYDLYRWTDHGGWDRLTHCARYRQVSVADDGSLFALQLNAGHFSIDKLDSNGAKVATVYEADEQQLISSFDVSRDGQQILLASKKDRQWSLLKFDRNSLVTTVLLRDVIGKNSVYFGEQANEYYFVADYEQQFNIWRLQGDQLQQLTRSASAVLHAAKPLASRLVFTQLSPQGEQLRVMPINSIDANAIGIDELNIGKTWTKPVISDERDYSALASLAPRAWLPNGFSGDGALALGVSVFGQDTLGLHQYLANPMIEITQHELLGDYLYSYDGRHSLMYSRRMKVESTRKEHGDKKVDSYTMREHAQWLSMWPLYRVDQTWLAGIGASFDDEQFKIVDFDTLNIKTQDMDIAAVYLAYDSRRAFFRSEGETDGQLLSLLWESYAPFDSYYQGDVYRLEWRGAVGLGESVLSARLLGARGDDNAEPYTLGGTFSEPHYGVPMLNLRDVALRGYDNGYQQLTGNNVNFGSIEWRFPISDIDRHLMTPPIGLNRLSATLFYDRGRAYDDIQREGSPFDRRDNDYYDSWGIELNAELKLGYLLELPIRVGVAHGRDPELGENQYYIRIGRAF